MLFCFSTSLHCQILFPCIFHVLAALRSIYRICFGTPAIPYEKSGFIMRPWQHLPNTTLLKAQALSPSIRHRYQWSSGMTSKKKRNTKLSEFTFEHGTWSTKHWHTLTPSKFWSSWILPSPKVDGFSHVFSPLYKPQQFLENTSWSIKVPVLNTTLGPGSQSQSTVLGDLLVFHKPLTPPKINIEPENGTLE